MVTIKLDQDELNYILSLILSRYNDIKKLEKYNNTEAVAIEVNREISILLPIYNKIEKVNNLSQINKSK